MASSAAPRWKTTISDALTEHTKSVVFQLATFDSHSLKPHVRSHIFRSFLETPGNEQLPLILTTTDIRTPKVAQILSNPRVELAWWIEGKQEQFRISGTASLVSAPDDPSYEAFSRVKVLEGLNWEEKRKEVFRTMSAHMKASWCRPVPGSRLVGGEEEAKSWPVRVDEPGHEKGEDGREVTEEDKAKNKENWETALKRFALLIIDPSEVDYVELGVLPNKRTMFRKSGGTWQEEAVVP
ncbi:hypothetical protein MPER_11737 [Moniliophthora perniciosa FA553]|nr:hypothetical protein MPER_11737 [Moniliophthora perniciosa FA553]